MEGSMEQRQEHLKGKRILVVDDDPDLCDLLQYELTRAGAEVCTAADGHAALRQLYALRPDLVILDIMMPGLDGWETCRQIRQLSDIPIMVLSALDREHDILRGLELGADDYVTKPCSGKVIVARAAAALRRAQLSSPTKDLASYADGTLTVDFEKRRVLVRGEPVELTLKEYQLLTYLIQNAGRVLTFQQILERVWGCESPDSVDRVHVHISHLRQKLGDDPRHPRYIHTEHGVGYRFEKLSRGSN
jgi:two-component system KDP operon response regulator KdpE